MSGDDGLRGVLTEALTTAWARGVPFVPEQGGNRMDFARYAGALLPVVTAYAEQLARERAAAAARERDALRAAVERLAESFQRQANAAANRAHLMERTDENVRHHAAERQEAQDFAQAASAARAVAADDRTGQR